MEHLKWGQKRKNPDLQTFYPLFPKGLYYGYIDDSGSLNAIVVHPQIAFHLSKVASVAPGAYLFWRESVGDGLYSAPGGLLRTAQSVGKIRRRDARPCRHVDAGPPHDCTDFGCALRSRIILGTDSCIWQEHWLCVGQDHLPLLAGGRILAGLTGAPAALNCGRITSYSEVSGQTETGDLSLLNSLSVPRSPHAGWGWSVVNVHGPHLARRSPPRVWGWSVQRILQ